MDIGKSVFDEYDSVLFALSKPDKGWVATGGMKALSGWRRACDQTCDPTTGDPYCYNTQTDCECDRAGGRYAPDGERCVQGKWCIYNIPPAQSNPGSVCPDCCLDTNMVMWDSSDPSYKVDSFASFVFCPPLGALAGAGGCACADSDDVRCNGECKNCSQEKTTKNAAGDEIPEVDCGNDINAHCGLDTTTCMCVACGDADHEVRGGANKWCCAKCQADNVFITPAAHKISDDDYQTVINDKEKACLCCPPAGAGQELDVSKLPNCVFKTQKYNCMLGNCVKDDDGRYESLDACRKAGCEDYECRTIGLFKMCSKTNRVVRASDPVVKGTYSANGNQTAESVCENACKGWTCVGVQGWNDCCQEITIVAANGAESYSTEARCKEKEQNCAAGRTPCAFPLADDVGCACKCVNGNAVDQNNPKDPCGAAGPAGPFPPKPGGGGGGTGGGGGGDGGEGGGGSSTSGSSSTSGPTCGTNAYLAPDGQCYCKYPAAILVNGSCQCAPGYALATDGVTCIDPSTQPGGNDGIGGSFMPDFKPYITPDFKPQRSACEDVICPPNQCCRETVFGFECRRC